MDYPIRFRFDIAGYIESGLLYGEESSSPKVRKFFMDHVYVPMHTDFYIHLDGNGILTENYYQFISPYPVPKEIPLKEFVRMVMAFYYMERSRYYPIIKLSEHGKNLIVTNFKLSDETVIPEICKRAVIEELEK
jgi:hypothetical protein